MTVVNLVVEDSLSEAVLRRILTDARIPVGTCYGLQGNNYIKQRVRAFSSAACHGKYFILTDLDSNPCPTQLKNDWVNGITLGAGLLFRVAVKEVESWLLADKANFSRYLGISNVRIPQNPDSINNPKEFIIELAKHSTKRNMREDIAPAPGSMGKRGKDYNGALIRFVQGVWDYQAAANHSKSLNGVLKNLGRLTN